jgi:uncharacterized protein (UPF0335 family)
MSDVLDIFEKNKKELPEIRYVLPGTQQELFLRPFTTREQKAILKSLEKNDQVLVGEAFDELIQKCVINKGFNVGDMYSKDRECLLIKLRLESVKEDFSHTWTCEHCKTSNTHIMDLKKLTYEENVNQSMMEKRVKLENNNSTLILGMSTRDDEKKILRHAKKNTSTIKNDVSQTEVLNAAYASVIKSIITTVEKVDQKTGKTVEEQVTMFVPFDDRLKILEHLTMNDRMEIKKFFEELESYGFDLKLGDLKCASCGKEQEESLEWMSFFIM